MCDNFADGNAAKQTSFGKLALPENYIIRSLGLREKRKESGSHKVASMGLVRITKSKCTHTCLGTDCFPGFLRVHTKWRAANLIFGQVGMFGVSERLRSHFTKALRSPNSKSTLLGLCLIVNLERFQKM